MKNTYCHVPVSAGPTPVELPHFQPTQFCPQIFQHNFQRCLMPMGPRQLRSDIILHQQPPLVQILVDLS